MTLHGHPSHEPATTHPYEEEAERDHAEGLPPSDDADLHWLTRKEPDELGQTDAIRTVDLFSGCGGLSLGVRCAARRLGRGFESVLAWDANTRANQVFSHNLKAGATLDDDIGLVLGGARGIAPSPAERALVEQLGAIDVLVAGPPCQGHSNLNNHTRRNDDRNGLYETVARFAELVRPSVIVVENVREVVHDKRGHAQSTRERLTELGYAVVGGSVALVSLGVPQTRIRHVQVASLSGTLPPLETLIAAFKVHHPRSVGWAISSLEDRGSVTATDVMERIPRTSTRNLGRIDYLFEHDLYDLPDAQRPACHKDGGHTYLSMYGRLRAGEPAQTITTGFGSPGQGRYIHPIRRRTITPREAARLQFFPDWFDFRPAGTWGQIARMIGNAVPPRLSEALVYGAIVHGSGG